MGQNLFLMSHPDVSLVNILLSITRVSLVKNKCVFCQLRVHFNRVFCRYSSKHCVDNLECLLLNIYDANLLKHELYSPRKKSIIISIARSMMGQGNNGPTLKKKLIHL